MNIKVFKFAGNSVVNKYASGNTSRDRREPHPPF